MMMIYPARISNTIVPGDKNLKMMRLCHFVDGLQSIQVSFQLQSRSICHLCMTNHQEIYVFETFRE